MFMKAGPPVAMPTKIDRHMTTKTAQNTTIPMTSPTKRAMSRMRTMPDASRLTIFQRTGIWKAGEKRS